MSKKKSKSEHARELIAKDPTLSVTDVAEKTGLSRQGAWRALRSYQPGTKIGRPRKPAIGVPKARKRRK